MKFSILLICVAIVLGGSPAIAQEKAENDKTYPRIDGNIIFRFLAYDGEYNADFPRIESDDIFFEIVASPEIFFTRRFSLDSDIRIETVRPPTEDRFFEEQHFFVRKLFFKFAVNDRLSLHAGKITPSFSFASFVTPGMYGINYNKEIELIERLGFTAEHISGTGAIGKHKLSVSTFFDDRTFLSDSLALGTLRRGRNRLADGGASNTESFESFTISLEGSEMSRLPGFTYKLAYVHEGAGEGDAADENGFLVAAMQSFQLDEKRSLTLIGEFAPLLNFQGTADDIIYTSAAIVYRPNPWTLTLSGTSRWRDLSTGGTFDDYALQTAAAYSLGRGTSIEIAHEFTRDENVNSRRIGFRFIKELNFN